ncbi:CPBP family intramembrane glutamic endopeptidase [Liquorilactobacillus capillatus]|uniref:CAAX prenyl protease 2/Lysostaphin resistance protein A-like domain-containing protein n=1 Tax=Liquorilactobacillus capillatus DSM 19910 TaxID=1423731 RepID=A0A0R1M3U8_9LACO|nr:CPBP family intramembrane glutamic endopeptidase [Liquorilactobacillus capillatus]KRL02417.1 hypothetical protein FC81_GL000761 [Liquorilactobacillus capillatus DSM 19910]
MFDSLQKIKINWKIIIFWIGILIFDDFIFTPLSVMLHLRGSYWLLGVYFKLAELLCAVVLNTLLLHQKVHLRTRIGKNSVMLFWAMGAILLLTLTSLNGNVKTALIVGTIASIPEEYIFRSVILGSLLSGISHVRAVKPVLIQIAVSSLLFSLYHLGNVRFDGLPGTLLQMIQVLGLGFLLGCLYVKKGSLIFPLIVHFFLDYIVTIIGKGVVAPSVSQLTIFSLGSALFIMCVYVMVGLILLDIHNY